jgi:glycosyltransferase involved in cell wall biosynthesis
LKILIIAPENTVGTLNLWKKAHEAHGNECTFITLYPTKHDYDQGICLNLPLVKANPLYMIGRHQYYKLVRGGKGDYQKKEGYPPVWEPNSFLERNYFQFRDWLWSFKVEKAIEEYGLLEYDIIHLDWGLEFYRDCRFVKRLKKAGKPIVCTYHGQDLRTRGVIPAIDKASNLNVTSELDLLKKHPDIQYLFLPFDTKQHQPSFKMNETIRICHSPTNRYYKGSETIIPICEKLAERENVEFVLIENMPHATTQKIKQSCDILIDQIHNRGGWGYGMNSVEALSMGLCCVTELVDEYVDFIPDHPFVNVNGDNLKEMLEELVINPEKIMEHRKKGREWIIKDHDIRNTSEVLYGYYKDRGLI